LEKSLELAATYFEKNKFQILPSKDTKFNVFIDNNVFIRDYPEQSLKSQFKSSISYSKILCSPQ
jgi:hypothetical protein